jgi:hypothetical protein
VSWYSAWDAPNEKSARATVPSIASPSATAWAVAIATVDVPAPPRPMTAIRRPAHRSSVASASGSIERASLIGAAATLSASVRSSRPKSSGRSAAAPSSSQLRSIRASLTTSVAAPASLAAAIRSRSAPFDAPSTSNAEWARPVARRARTSVEERHLTNSTGANPEVDQRVTSANQAERGGASPSTTQRSAMAGPAVR